MGGWGWKKKGNQGLNKRLYPASGLSLDTQQACHEDNLVSSFGNQFKASVIIKATGRCDSYDS